MLVFTACVKYDEWKEKNSKATDRLQELYLQYHSNSTALRRLLGIVQPSHDRSNHCLLWHALDKDQVTNSV